MTITNARMVLDSEVILGLNGRVQHQADIQPATKMQFDKTGGELDILGQWNRPAARLKDAILRSLPYITFV